MPDIDKLQELSAVLGISINELLAGERIEDASAFAKKADENLVEILSKDSAFGLQDRIAYFKQKWRKEHMGLMGFWGIAWCVLCFAGVFTRMPLILVCLPITAVIIYEYLRNQMMIYVEQRAFVSELQQS